MGEGERRVGSGGASLVEVFDGSRRKGAWTADHWIAVAAACAAFVTAIVGFGLEVGVWVGMASARLRAVELTETALFVASMALLICGAASIDRLETKLRQPRRTVSPLAPHATHLHLIRGGQATVDPRPRLESR